MADDQRYYLMDLDAGLWRVLGPPPQPYGFDAQDRKVISFIQRVKIPSRQCRSISHAFDVLYLNSLYLMHHFVYLKRKITFYKWEIVHMTASANCKLYVCDLSFCNEGIILQIDCPLIKKYLDVELTVPVNDIQIYDRVQRVLYSRRLIEQYQKSYVAWHLTEQK
jgi:hypothetical protein